MRELKDKVARSNLADINEILDSDFSKLLNLNELEAMTIYKVIKGEINENYGGIEIIITDFAPENVRTDSDRNETKILLYDLIEQLASLNAFKVIVDGNDVLSVVWNLPKLFPSNYSDVNTYLKKVLEFYNYIDSEIPYKVSVRSLGICKKSKENNVNEDNLQEVRFAPGWKI